MDGSSRSTDSEYERTRTKAEKQFYLDSVRWEKALLDQARKIPVPEKQDPQSVLKNIAAAAWKGEPPGPIGIPPSVNFFMIVGLIKMCVDFIKAELDAFSALLQRSNVATSTAVAEIERHALADLEEVHKRKWKSRITQILVLFPGSVRLEDSWVFVQDETEEYIRDTLEPHLWFGSANDANPAPSEENRSGSTRANIEQFIVRIFLAEGQRISKTDIWTVAGYSDNTQFERYQREDKRTSQAARDNFERVLNLPPKAFLELLDRVKLK